MTRRILFALSLLCACAVSAAAQNAPAATNAPRPELAVSFVALHSNAPVKGCGCFWLYGPQATVAVPVGRSFSLVGDMTWAQTNNAAGSGDTITINTWTTGVRFTPVLRTGKVIPFGQATIGAAHSFGTLVNGVTNSGLAFAAQLGGGADLDITHHIRWRIAQASYTLTTFQNSVSDRQNNLQLNSGIVWRF